MATSMDITSSQTTDASTNKIQQKFVVISWNVLHMVHEINHVYDMSPVITQYKIKEQWSNEKFRLNDIVKTLSQLLLKHSTIECFICLQEVPGDLLPLLREMIDSHVGSALASQPLIHTHNYPRIPRVRKIPGASLYTDSNESLVTIHYNPNIISADKVNELENTEQRLLSGDRTLWTQCPTDPGKGALTVTTASGLSVVNIHVPYDKQAAIALLSNIPWPENNDPFVFVGDMNRGSTAFMKMIAGITAHKSCFNLLFPLTTERATRVGVRQAGTRDKSWIDYYTVSASLKNLAILPAEVCDDIGDISDHYPILLQFKAV